MTSNYNQPHDYYDEGPQQLPMEDQIESFLKYLIE